MLFIQSICFLRSVNTPGSWKCHGKWHQIGILNRFPAAWSKMFSWHLPGCLRSCEVPRRSVPPARGYLRFSWPEALLSLRCKCPPPSPRCRLCYQWTAPWTPAGCPPPCWSCPRTPWGWSHPATRTSGSLSPRHSHLPYPNLPQEPNQHVLAEKTMAMEYN